MDLVELYFEIVYPIFPLFHQPSFIRRISRAEYSSDRALFSLTMAVCALVSARVRDGAVFNPGWDTRGLKEPKPQVFYHEAVRRADTACAQSDLNSLRVHAVLALAAIQDGKIRDMHAHFSRYHAINAIEGLHDEDNWPKHIGTIEVEERRRLFWSMYTLDVFTSIAWGGVIRSREGQSNVSYPTEVDDDMFDDTGFADTSIFSESLNVLPSQDSAHASGISWLAGRNTVTDLYRVIEHSAIPSPARRGRAQRKMMIDDIIQDKSALSQDVVRKRVMQMYADLPQSLKETRPVQSKPRLDRFGFQAADIIATVQLVRMVLLCDDSASILEKCQIANEVVSAFIAIPTAYHRAISVPLLFHLGVIGQMLSTTLEEPLSEQDYRSIRDVTFAMAQLLSTLEDLHASKGASQRLRNQIARIDEYMMSQRSSIGTQQRNLALTHAAAQAPLESSQPLESAASGSAGMTETLLASPFQLPPDVVGDFSQIFDFGQITQDWSLENH
ncbi:hypothetical protein KC331_g102 [Hortaea werneckii]|uniref:Xylanolytic transcriptional activator regulatory domain-containing protein n=1 Tax=Hortaea werneckii TaxID=91943 RepID=A0A3M7DDG9_HORWE|nr:hypothetical protein KC331_g102 [Hortaea werneckii]KAI7722860.1 hypothetical protein KC353_g144 [Hortaea werneckii]RMY62260.1 hypothetical protein D0865_00529 [Hortaea werneckii]